MKKMIFIVICLALSGCAGKRLPPPQMLHIKKQVTINKEFCLVSWWEMNGFGSRMGMRKLIVYMRVKSEKVFQMEREPSFTPMGKSM